MAKQLIQIIEKCGQCFFKNSLFFEDAKKGFEIKPRCNHPNFPEKFKNKNLDLNKIHKSCPLEDYVENKK